MTEVWELRLQCLDPFTNPRVVAWNIEQRKKKGRINRAHPLQHGLRHNGTQIIWSGPTVTSHHAADNCIRIKRTRKGVNHPRD